MMKNETKIKKKKTQNKNKTHLQKISLFLIHNLTLLEDQHLFFPPIHFLSYTYTLVG